jgi:NADPH:quinone reductase
VLVRVHASSVNPVDNSIAAGMLRQMGVEYDFPVILGRDYAGVVDEVGAGVSSFAVGDRVFGFLLHANPSAHDGSWADLITVPQESSIAKAPEGVDLAAAGAAPLAGITAMLSIDAVDLSEGDTVLVVGATGGVGSLAVQLASRGGATVVAPALPEDEDYLRDLGVSELLPREADLAAAARERYADGFDAVLDLVNYGPGVPASLVKDGGRVASPHRRRRRGPRKDDDHGCADLREPAATCRTARRRRATSSSSRHLRARAGARRTHRPRHDPHPRKARRSDRTIPPGPGQAPVFSIESNR